MKKLMFLLLVASAFVHAQDADEQAAMAAMVKHMTPSKTHTMMAQSAGSWKTETKLWMAPGQPPSVSEGTCENTMILGGRFLRSSYKGSVMGMPFEGEGMLAYDNTKKELVTTWMDNLSTSLLMMKGKYDVETHSMIFEGAMLDPMTGGDQKVRMVTRHESKDRIVFEMYMVMPEGEFKQMEIIHTRVS